jgi:hypothetical protein
MPRQTDTPVDLIYKIIKWNLGWPPKLVCYLW